MPDVSCQVEEAKRHADQAKKAEEEKKRLEKELSDLPAPDELKAKVGRAFHPVPNPSARHFGATAWRGRTVCARSGPAVVFQAQPRARRQASDWELGGCRRLRRRGEEPTRRR